MDKTQIYLIILLSVGLTAGAFQHGQRKDGYHNFVIDLIATALNIPIFGRVFGWW